MTDRGGHGGASENAAVGRFHEVIHENKEHGKPSAPRRGRRLYFRKGLSNPIPESHLVRPKKISHRKPEIFSGFLYFSRISSLFQKLNINADKKMQTPIFDRREGSEPKNRHFRGIFDDIFSSDIPLFSFYKY